MSFIPRSKLVELWNAEPRVVPVDMMLTSAELEDSANSPWGFYDPLSQYLDPALLKRLGLTKATATPGCAAYSLGIFQQTERWALSKFRLGGVSSWWGNGGIHLACKRGDSLADSLCSFEDYYIILQLEQYDVSMGQWYRHYEKNPWLSFARYNGSGKAAREYADKAMSFLEKIMRELGTV